jgi:Protein of unknwon function (DUF3310)
MSDPVNPDHYAAKAVTPVQVVDACELNFYLGNVVKYVMRHKEKNGREDLKKALWYLLYELGIPVEKIKEITNGVD